MPDSIRGTPGLGTLIRGRAVAAIEHGSDHFFGMQANALIEQSDAWFDVGYTQGYPLTLWIDCGRLKVLVGVVLQWRCHRKQLLAALRQRLFFVLPRNSIIAGRRKRVGRLDSVVTSGLQREESRLRLALVHQRRRTRQSVLKALRILALIIRFPIAIGLGLCGLCGALCSVSKLPEQTGAAIAGVVSGALALGIAYALFLLIFKMFDGFNRDDS